MFRKLNRRNFSIHKSFTKGFVAQYATPAAAWSNIPAEDLQQIEAEAAKSHPDPGPDSQTHRLIAQYAPYMVTTYARNPIALTAGQGAYVWDLEGNRYIDFNAGIAVSSLGHGDLEIATIMREQAMQLIHSSNLFYSPWSWKLAQLLVESTRSSGGMKDAAKVFFCNSGTEANEAAIKFARKYGSAQTSGTDREKYKIMSFKNAFHGRTMGALSATANEKYQAPFKPMVPGFVYADYNDMSILDQLDETFCGVLIEPIQGEGGIFTANGDFLVALRKKCDEIGAVLVFDEIQCGLGRSGKLWAHSHFSKDCHPDIMTMAKPLANGVPIGATMVTDKVAEAIKIGDHGTTFGGNPLACRVGHHVLSQLSSESLMRNVDAQSKRILKALHNIQKRFPDRVVDVRGRGLLLGMQLDADPSPIVKFAREKGLLLITAGHNTIRFVPPLIIEAKVVDEAMHILGDAMQMYVDAIPSKKEGNQDLAKDLPREATG